MTAVADTASAATVTRWVTVPPSVVVLARVEAARILRHPAFVVGLLAGALAVWQGITIDADAEWPGAGYYQASVSWFPLWVGTLLASALSAGRGRLLEDPDLFPAAPMPAYRRVHAAVLALAAPVAVSIVAMAIEAVAVARVGGFRVADAPFTNGLVTPSLAEWVQQPLLVLLAGVVGVVLAQLRRGRALALLVVSTATFLGSALTWVFAPMPFRAMHPLFLRNYEQRMGDTWRPDAWMPGDAPLLVPDEFMTQWREIRFDDAALLWHLVGLAALVALGVGVAIRLADRDVSARRWLLGGGAAFAVALGAQVLVGGPT